MVFYANQIIELINRNMKKQRTTIGRIDLMQNFSFFEVAENQAQDVIKALNKVNLNGGRKIVVEVAGDNNGKNDNGERRSSAARNASFGKKGDRSNKKTTSKEGKTSRAERGYIEERGPQKRKTTGNNSLTAITIRKRNPRNKESNLMKEDWT